MRTRRIQRHEARGQRLLRFAALLVFALGAALNLWLAITLIGRPDETRYGESIIYDHAARLVRGEPLYQRLDAPPYTVATYTPLYYAVVAALHAALGPGFAPGRLVSFISGLAATGLVGYLAGRRTQALWPAVAAASLFGALGLVGPFPWTAAYKEDVLGIALGLACISVLDVTSSTFGVVAAAALAAATVLTKQSLVGPALCGFVWLLACRGRHAPLFGGVTFAIVAAVALALELTSGAFLANTIDGNRHQPFDAFTLGFNLRELFTFQMAPGLIALVSVASRRVMHDLLALNWIGSLIPLVPLGAVGADYNYWLSFAAASAVLAASVVWEQRDRWTGVLTTALLAVNAAVGALVVGSPVAAHAEFIVGQPTDRAVFAELVGRVQSSAGTVLADPLDVLVLAERPILLEPILYSLYEADRSWDAGPLVKRICAGEVQLVILGYPADEAAQRFPARVARAIQETMRTEATLTVAGRPRVILVPTARSPTAEPRSPSCQT